MNKTAHMFWISGILFLTVLLSACSTFTHGRGPRPFVTKVNLSDYRLVWSDGFNGNAVNTDEWHYRTDNSWGSTQLPANVSEADGLLRIDLRKQDAGGKHYTGGGIITKRHFEFGYYETRMRMPASPGWHTSFWMAGFDNMKSPTGASGGLQELDCCEQDSFEQSSYTHNIHMRKPAYLTGWTRIRTPNLTQGFHVWGCEFTPRHVRYFFDGQMVGVYDIAHWEKGDQQIWLTSIAANIGGKTGTPIDADLPQRAEFDYVRFFQK